MNPEHCGTTFLLSFIRRYVILNPGSNLNFLNPLTVETAMFCSTNNSPKETWYFSVCDHTTLRSNQNCGTMIGNRLCKRWESEYVSNVNACGLNINVNIKKRGKFMNTKKIFSSVNLALKKCKMCPVWGSNSRPSDYYSGLWDWRAAYCANEALTRTWMCRNILKVIHTRPKQVSQTFPTKLQLFLLSWTFKEIGTFAKYINCSLKLRPINRLYLS